MASAGLRDELLCSICLNLYTDPVTLRCGHNFCRVCIDQVLNTQDESGVYSCPECREEIQEWPALQKNITLCNVVENFQSDYRDDAVICCTYCIHSPVPAVISCLLCEASLCDKHLRLHSKEEEHVLTAPGTSLENRNGSDHKELFTCHCTEDAACICVSCSLAGEHQGHQMKMLDEASEKKKKKLKDVLQKLATKIEKTEERIQSLEERTRKAEEKAAGETKKVNVLFTDIRRRLDNQEKKVRRKISKWEHQVSQPLSDAIQKLEIKKDELSRKMRHIEELCNMTDPLTVLQDPDTGDLCDPEEEEGDEGTGGHDGGDEDTGGHDGGDEDTGGHDGGDEDTGGHDGGDEDTGGHDGGDEDTGGHDGGDEDTEGHDGGDRDVEWLSHVSHTFSGIVQSFLTFYVQDPADILLDVNTAAPKILISDDLKTAFWRMFTDEPYPETAERFKDYHQVMSISNISSGRHYWDVEISSEDWMVGMCYPSIARRGRQSHIGDNNKSWGLYGGCSCEVKHDNTRKYVHHHIYSGRVRIYLDYEAGRLSFYELCDPIRHLHTFTATFTEPLHVALGISYGCMKMTAGTWKILPRGISSPL